MYNDEIYINKRNIYYQKYFADVLYSSAVSRAKKNRCERPFVFERLINVSELSTQDCYRIASHQRALFFRVFFVKVKEKIKLGIYNFTHHARKRREVTSKLDA